MYIFRPQVAPLNSFENSETDWVGLGPTFLGDGGKDREKNPPSPPPRPQIDISVSGTVLSD